ncbi:restriction endonuclease subunit M [Paucihalobacter ruber]|uniref:site-specific DNA-methyltransferase (adenine-specific) n=1 Tax=Paucihalobacter ruber TaxID=2567861 RepID=A0A506PHC5_9FLAO|nr:DNA methyltransferase [Paucihalobacter ruber]TPV33233.1 restriction endonuclease subunit M [Paucihalobacter ruber]
MPLFQTSVLKSHLAQQDHGAIAQLYKKYAAYFHNITIQENIKNSKEEQYQAKFLDELFVNILGYTLNPHPEFNLTTEFKNQKGAGKADGAILKDNKAIGVIELKGTGTKDLESIRKQAFDYKANQKGCVYVITSNFEKLRFYINDATEFLEFNLFQLAPEEFALLHLCLHKNNLLNNLPLSIKEASLVEEEHITKQFYKDYSVFKRELFRDLVKRNAKRLKADAAQLNNNAQDEVISIEKNVKLSLFKKSQKLIDRFLFIFFAEDRDLLPPNSTIQILDKWKADVDFGDERPLYNLFKQYFHFLDTGRKGTGSRAEIYAYNGGLFKPDTILDNLEIDDQLLYKHTYQLAKYDFSSQVDVNILGHIFENSLNEIESVNAEIEGGQFDKQTSKRKKDGVFYTPKYITKYIVENTVGKLCQEKKETLGFKEEAYFEVKKGTQTNTKKALLQILDDYRNWLLQITICDPACGSGAFLNQALDFLIKEHRYIDELKAKVLGGGLILSDIENTILENNIYGVDLNEESVEIAKLSLWLRTAQPRRKLNDLSSNIKCGNSLIDDKKVAGDKAFNWQQEFPQIFTKGGFDVVIGNPPYVRHELITEYKDYLADNYLVFQSTADLYVYFIEKGLLILKYNGFMGYITPNKFVSVTYGKNLREIIGNKYWIDKLIDFGELPVFSDAATFPFISIIRNISPSAPSKFVKIQSLKNLDIDIALKNDGIIVSTEVFKLSDWRLIPENEGDLLKKISMVGVELKNYLEVPFYRGILTGFNEAFIINEVTKSKLIDQDNKSKEIIKPFVDGDDVRNYHLRSKNKYIIFTRRGTDIERYPAIKKHLQEFYDKLVPKTKNTDKVGRKKGDYRWYEIQDSISYFNEFEKPKIIYPEIAKESRFTLDLNKVYLNKTIFFIPIEDYYLLSILNSRVVWFFLSNTCTALGDPKNGGRLNIQKVYLEKTPIPKDIDKNIRTYLEEKSKTQLTLCTQLYNDTNKFLFYIESTLNVVDFSKKLETWYGLEFSEFITELNKAIKKSGGVALSKKDEFEWLELFEDNKKKAQELRAQIAQTEKAIDDMVYDLYGLTQEEREIVENS